MKKLALLCLVLALLLTFVGCSCGVKENEPQISTTGTDITETPDVSTPPPAETGAVPGSSVELKSNAGTGYEWVCTVDNEAVATAAVETETGDTDLVGGEITTKITFTGVTEGATFAIAKLERSFEENSAVELHVYTLKVDEDLNVTIAEVEMPKAEMTVPAAGDVSIEVTSPAIIVYGGEYDENAENRLYYFTTVLPLNGEVTFNAKDADGNVTGTTIYSVEMTSDNKVTATLKS